MGIRPRGFVKAGAATLAAALALTACSSNNDPGNSSSAATGSSSAGAPSFAPSSAPGGHGGVSGSKVPLTFYAAEGWDSAIAKAFQTKTGIQVKLVDDSTGPLLTKIAAEKNNPQWDMVWVDGDTAFASLDKQGLLQDYTPNASYTALGKTLIPKDHSYNVTGTTVMAALIYNSARATAVPKTYQDLLTSAYQGKVGMNDPSQSGPTYPFIAGLMNQMGGVQQGEAYFGKLKQNGIHVYPTNGDTLHALETGQIDYGLIQSSAATGEVASVKPTTNFKPKVIYLSKSVLLPSAIGIAKGVSPQAKAEAEQFVDFALSPAGQAVMQSGDPKGDSLFWPIINGVNSLPTVPSFPTSYQRLDPYQWGPQESSIDAWFDQNVK